MRKRGFVPRGQLIPATSSMLRKHDPHYTPAEQTFIEGLHRQLNPGPVKQRSLPSGKYYSLVLSCSHPVEFVSPAPQVSDIIYCRKCTTYRVVTEFNGEI